jgi:hypothetical protein
MAAKDDDVSQDAMPATSSRCSGGSDPTASDPPPLVRPGSAGRSVGPLRLAILACAATALPAGLWFGLERLGWDLPRGASLAGLHGPLLISGVFGTLVAMERAVALGGRWPYAAPALSASGSVLLVAGAPTAAGAWAYALAAAFLTAASLVAVRRQPAAFTASLAAGAAAWLASSGLWAVGNPVPDLAGWWLAFLVLTIAGERLELSRLGPRSRLGLPLYLVATGAFLTGAAEGLYTARGASLSGLGLVALTVWLIRHDIALRTVRLAGQARFMATCMLAGYAWLGTAGLLLLAAQPGMNPFGYDMAVHAVLLGFVLSMVFGHALIILPAVAHLRPRYGPAMYAPLATLHASVALRVASDLLGAQAGRRWSGLVTVAAVAGFAACMAVSTRSARPRADRSAP